MRAVPRPGTAIVRCRGKCSLQPVIGQRHGRRGKRGNAMRRQIPPHLCQAVCLSIRKIISHVPVRMHIDQTWNDICPARINPFLRIRVRHNAARSGRIFRIRPPLNTHAPRNKAFPPLEQVRIGDDHIHPSQPFLFCIMPHLCQRGGLWVWLALIFSKSQRIQPVRQPSDSFQVHLPIRSLSRSLIDVFLRGSCV